MTHAILILFLVWRIGLFLVAWISSILLEFAPRFPYADVFLIPSRLPQWLWSFANFDGVHYLTIASTGYSAQFTQVFFPLFPLIISIIHTFLPISSVVLGLAVSNILFLAVLFILVKLLELDYRKDTIIVTLLMLLTFPTSFYFGSFYTESLFLFLTLGAFLAARKKHWLLSGFFGGFASVTRLVGIFLLPALLWEWHVANVKCQMSNVKTKSKNLNLIYLIKKVQHVLTDIVHSPITYLVPLGLLSYMIYLFIEHNDPLYFWHVQPTFGAARLGTGVIFLPQVVFRYVKIFTSISVSEAAFFTAVLEFAAMALAISSLIVAHLKKVRLSYLIFSWFAVIIPTLTGTFSSMPRYILVAFPIYIALALQMHTKVATVAMILVSAALLIVLTMLFTSGRWVA